MKTEKPLSFESLRGEMAPFFSKGVITNTFLSESDYRMEIAAGTLSLARADGALMLLRKREDYYILNFFIKNASSGFCLPDLPLVTELVRRSDNRAAFDALICSGFSRYISRVQLSRPAGVLPQGFRDPGTALPALPGDAPACLAILRASLDKWAGCVPLPEELERDIEGGLLFCARGERGEPYGVLRYGKRMGATEIRHLAVSPESRRKGAAVGLTAAYLNASSFGKSIVWTGASNAAALEFYRKFGYAESGIRSDVLRLGIINTSERKN